MIAKRSGPVTLERKYRRDASGRRRKTTSELQASTLSNLRGSPQKDLNVLPSSFCGRTTPTVLSRGLFTVKHILQCLRKFLVLNNIFAHSLAGRSTSSTRCHVPASSVSSAL